MTVSGEQLREEVVALPRPGRSFRGRLTDFAFGFAIIALILFASVMSDSFLTERNLVNVSRQMVTNGLLSMGMLIVVLSGGIDLSVGSVVALAGILATGLQLSLPLPLAILIGILAGMAVGVANGVLIAYFRLEPFIVTLATMGAVRGGIYIYSQTPQYASDPFFTTVLGAGKLFGTVPYIFLIFVFFLPIIAFFLNYMRPGRAIVAIGINAEAARLAGIDVRKHIVGAYVLCAFLAAVAGVLLAAKLGLSQPSVGVAYELDAIAAVVIGGGILGGGGGTVAGMVGGVIALSIIDNALNLFNVQAYYQQVVKGLIILVAVLARRKPKD
jgi:ribose/xylose/arabinose/galactoside ABC-type transport system permease subunit